MIQNLADSDSEDWCRRYNDILVDAQPGRRNLETLQYCVGNFHVYVLDRYVIGSGTAHSCWPLLPFVLNATLSRWNLCHINVLRNNGM